MFYDQQEDNSTDYNSIYIDLTQYLNFFGPFLPTVDSLNFMSLLFTQLSLSVGEKIAYSAISSVKCS